MDNEEKWRVRRRQAKVAKFYFNIYGSISDYRQDTKLGVGTVGPTSVFCGHLPTFETSRR
jgi:hypothetical protein